MTESAGERRAFLVLVAGLAVLHLAPLVCFRFFPSQDGPVHLEMAVILEQLRAGDGAFARYFEVNPRPQPNLLVYLALVPLAKLLGAGMAEKALLAAYVVAFPAGLAYALTGVRRDGICWLPLAFPLAFSFLLHMGFYNFCIGVALSLFTLGYWLRHPDELHGRRVLWLALWVLATGLAHAVALGVLLVVLATLTGWEVVRERAAARRAQEPAPGLAETVRRRLLPLAVGALPPVVLIASFFAGAAPEPPYRMGWLSLLKVLALLHSLVSFDPWEIAVSVGIWLLVAGTALAATTALVARRREPGRQGGGPSADGLLAAAAVVLGLYFLVPTGFAGGGFFSQRLQLYLVLLLVLWLAGQPLTPARRRALVAAGTALALFAWTLHLRAYRRLDPLLVEYVSLAPRLAPGSTLLSLSFVEPHHRPSAPGASYKVWPFVHAAGYLAAESGLVDLACYQAERSYFPVRYRDAVNPYRHLTSNGDLEESPAGVDLLAYEKTGGQVDYVVLWGLWGERRTRADVQPLLTQLAEAYDRVEVSRPLGLGELYRRRPGRAVAGD